MFGDVGALTPNLWSEAVMQAPGLGKGRRAGRRRSKLFNSILAFSAATSAGVSPLLEAGSFICGTIINLKAAELEGVPLNLNPHGRACHGHPRLSLPRSKA
jgi:hypothetical protein